MGTDQVDEWVRSAQGGDRAAFGCLVEEFQDLISAVCLGHLGDPERARDAAQDTFVSALGAIKSLREPRAFVAWLLKLARTAWRHERTRWEAELPADLASPAPERPGEADALVRCQARVAYSMCCTSLLVIVACPALGWAAGFEVEHSGGGLRAATTSVRPVVLRVDHSRSCSQIAQSVRLT